MRVARRTASQTNLIDEGPLVAVEQRTSLGHLKAGTHDLVGSNRIAFADLGWSSQLCF